jgi:hypothetical protein
MMALAAMQHMKMSDLEFSEAFGKAGLSGWGGEDSNLHIPD